MKELLTSFLFSAKSNLHGEKSSTTGCTHITSGGFILPVLMVCAFFLASIPSSVAQSSAPVAALITTDAYSHDEWKAPAEYTAVIDSEVSETIVLLDNPNLTTAEIALYTGYSRMLDYIKVDLEANRPIAEIAYNNFKKVTKEAETDPKLIGMSMTSFQSMYAALVVQLHQ